jgi:hypothetical protein
MHPTAGVTTAIKRGVTQTAIGAAVRELRVATRVHPAHSRGFEGRLVWIFGSPRSGSSWLLRLLAEHPVVVPVNEPLIGFYLGPFLSDLPGGAAETMDCSTFTIRRVQSQKQAQFFAEQFSDVWVPGLGRLLRERFYAHATRLGSQVSPRERIVVIKEPNGSQSADVIMRSLPQSKLVFLLRDGRDVVDSELAANLEGSWAPREFPGLRGIRESERLPFVIQSAHKWLWRTEVVEAAVRAHRGPTHLVRYEELLADPHAELRRLLNWLQLEVDHDLLAEQIARNAFERAPATGPDQFHRSASPGGWRVNLSPEEQAAVDRILGTKLRKLGYEP